MSRKYFIPINLHFNHIARIILLYILSCCKVDTFITMESRFNWSPLAPDQNVHFMSFLVFNIKTQMYIWVCKEGSVKSHFPFQVSLVTEFINHCLSRVDSVNHIIQTYVTKRINKYVYTEHMGLNLSWKGFIWHIYLLTYTMQSTVFNCTKVYKSRLIFFQEIKFSKHCYISYIVNK